MGSLRFIVLVGGNRLAFDVYMYFTSAVGNWWLTRYSACVH